MCTLKYLPKKVTGLILRENRTYTFLPFLGSKLSIEESIKGIERNFETLKEKGLDVSCQSWSGKRERLIWRMLWLNRRFGKLFCRLAQKPFSWLVQLIKLQKPVFFPAS